MFVEQEEHDRDDAGDGEFAQIKGWEQGNQQEQHYCVEEARDPERAGDADVARDGVEPGTAVEIEILAGVEDVETSDPEGDGGGENKNARIEGTANGDPGGSGRDARASSSDGAN